MTASFNLGNLLKTAGTGGSSDCPSGECTIEVVTADAVDSKNGRPMLKIKAKILDGVYAGRTIYDNIVLVEDSPEAMVYFFGKLDSLGIADRELLSQCVGTLKPLALAAAGRRARVNLEPREWPKDSGRWRAGVKDYLGRATGSEDEAGEAGTDDVGDFDF